LNYRGNRRPAVVTSRGSRTTIDRRQFVRTLLAAAAGAAPACMAHHAASRVCPGPHSDFMKANGLSTKLDVWHIGDDAAPPLVVLHELPGLTDDDLALARCLSKRGFHVFTPLLFGRLGQDSATLGFASACLGSPPRFECSRLSARSEILNELEAVCDRIAACLNMRLGVIGMCLTGALPLALLPNRVDAAVLSQPTLPFDVLRRRPVGPQLTDLGLGPDDLKEAVASHVPFLAMHYADDPLSPRERLATIADTFGTRAAIIELPGSGKHSSLAGDLHIDALEDCVNYLKVRLGVETGPKRMMLARLEHKACEITRDGWKSVP
jgi:dienelactone hydrolase